MAETNGQFVSQPFAIATLLAREKKMNHFIGETAFSKSQIDQYVIMSSTSIKPAASIVESVIFGHTPTSDKFD